MSHRNMLKPYSMDKAKLEKLHTDLLSAWNKQDATKMASLFSDNGISIG